MRNTSEDKTLFTFRVIVICIAVLCVMAMLPIIGKIFVESENSNTTRLTQIGLNAEIICDNGEPVPVSGKDVPNFKTASRVVVAGCPNTVIPINENIMFFARDCAVEVKMNGRIILTPNTLNGMFSGENALGEEWISFKSPGIKTTDKLEFIMTPISGDIQRTSVSQMLSTLYVGNTFGLYSKMFAEKGFVIALSLFLVCGGLLLMLFSLATLAGNFAYMRRVLPISFMVIAGALWFMFDENITYNSIIVPNHAAHIFLRYILAYVLSTAVTVYLTTFVNERHRKTIMMILCVFVELITLTAVLLHVTGIRHLYEIQLMATAAAAVMFASIVIFVVDTIITRKRINLIVLLTLSPGMVGALFQISLYLFEIQTEFKSWFSLGIMLAVVSQFVIVLRVVRSNASMLRDLRESENERMRNRILIMMSQLQPHFLFNALNVIKYLCGVNTEKAKMGIESFAKCLRANIESLRIDYPIPFSQELKHLQSYAFLERIRFGENIEVVYNIESDDFCLPPLTIQPIVENAIRHGITQKGGGGTITVTAKKVDGGHQVLIEDTGIGFDVNKMYQNVAHKIDEKKPRVGLTSVRNRIESMCGGTLDVFSVEGIGTTVTIFVPEQEDKRERAF
ncbi:MAG: histidine kinase [Clostridia bacterium]|nr:histidine kinase [Clostridia bacterium]